MESSFEQSFALECSNLDSFENDTTVSKWTKCRLCSARKNLCRLDRINTKDRDKLPYCIRFFTGIQVVTNVHICSDCFELIILICSFRNKCQQNESLRKQGRETSSFDHLDDSMVQELNEGQPCVRKKRRYTQTNISTSVSKVLLEYPDIKLPHALYTKNILPSVVIERDPLLTVGIDMMETDSVLSSPVASTSAEIQENHEFSVTESVTTPPCVALAPVYPLPSYASKDPRLRTYFTNFNSDVDNEPCSPNSSALSQEQIQDDVIDQAVEAIPEIIPDAIPERTAVVANSSSVMTIEDQIVCDGGGHSFSIKSEKSPIIVDPHIYIIDDDCYVTPSPDEDDVTTVVEDDRITSDELFVMKTTWDLSTKATVDHDVQTAGPNGTVYLSKSNCLEFSNLQSDLCCYSYVAVNTHKCSETYGEHDHSASSNNTGIDEKVSEYLDVLSKKSTVGLQRGIQLYEMPAETPKQKATPSLQWEIIGSRLSPGDSNERRLRVVQPPCSRMEVATSTWTPPHADEDEDVVFVSASVPINQVNMPALVPFPKVRSNLLQGKDDLTYSTRNYEATTASSVEFTSVALTSPTLGNGLAGTDSAVLPAATATISRPEPSISRIPYVQYTMSQPYMQYNTTSSQTQFARPHAVETTAATSTTSASSQCQQQLSAMAPAHCRTKTSLPIRGRGRPANRGGQGSRSSAASTTATRATSANSNPMQSTFSNYYHVRNPNVVSNSIGVQQQRGCYQTYNRSPAVSFDNSFQRFIAGAPTTFVNNGNYARTYQQPYGMRNSNSVSDQSYCAQQQNQWPTGHGQNDFQSYVTNNADGFQRAS